MEKVLIFGHKNPDTDTICSAIAYADLKKQLGMDVEPVRLGQINGET
ncbi:MAG: DHH family phosphoesterase, partial [Bacillus sp. (in: firmicutes)]